MGIPTSNHRPLRAGIAIMPSDGEEHRGTLGAVARRKSDLAKVLVTAVHVVSTHRNNYTVNGTESIYQGGTAEGDKVGQLFRHTVNGVEKKSWAEGDNSNNYPIDAAALALPTGADIEALTSFNVHFPNDDDDNHTHIEKRPIVGPAVDPTSGMHLIAVGAASGYREMEVLNPTPSSSITVSVYARERPHGFVANYNFDKTKNFTIRQNDDPSQRYDSGSPILWVDEHGNYRIVGIHFGGKNTVPGGDNVIGYASRAIAIEEELGITFGIKRPTAVAGDDIAVSTGSQVMLDGSRSQSKEVLRDVLTYHWEQDFGSAHAATMSRDGVTLSSVSAVSPTFTAPAHATTLKFKLTVTDGFGAKHTDKVIVTVDNIPPIPREDQWEVRQQGNKIQVKATELPTVIPAISQVKAKLGISPLGTGLGSDTITVIKDIGTTLNRWVDVLTDADSKWQVGTWTAQVRFENTEGVSEYSPGKSVTVPNHPPVAKPGINRVVPVHTLPSLTPAVTLVGAAEDPDPGHVTSMTYAWSVDSAPDGNTGSGTRSAVLPPSSRVVLTTPIENGEEVPNKRTFTPDAIGDYVFTLTVTDPGELFHSANMTIHACSATGTSQWYDTGETRGSGATFAKKQTRWHNGVAEFRWQRNNPPVANAGYNEVARANTRVTLSGAAGDPDASDQDDLSYRWSKRSGAFVQMDGTRTLAPTFTAPGFDTTLKFRLTVTDPHGAKDTDNVTVWVYDSLTSPWHDTGEEDGCGRSKRKRQTRLNLGVVKFRWRATPEPVVWTDWEDTGETRNEATGAWTDTGSRRENPVTLVTEKEQTRAITWEKEQERTNQCDQTGTQWVDASRTETQWVEGLLAPTNVTATPSTRSVELSWDAVSGATGYEVEIGIPGNAGGLGHTSETTTDTTITISNLIPEKTYEYRVRGTTTRVDGPWTDWATVVTEGEEPPQPTSDQWNFRYSSNKLQAKVISLPTVIPVITEVELTMETGQPPNLNTVTKNIGTSLDTWVDVLTRGQTGWTTGTWIAQIRFRNSADYGPYSDVKSDTVPTPEMCTWQDVSPSETRNRVEGAYTGTGSTRNRQAGNWMNTGIYRGSGSSREQKQTRTITWEAEESRTTTWEKQQECVTPSGIQSDTRWVSDSSTGTRWVATSTTETRWVSDPPPVTHSYRDITPAIYSGCGPSRRRKQECVRLGHEDTDWRDAPEEYRWGRWYNTEHERNEVVGPWRNTSNYRGCGSDRERQQAQTITWENEQERQSHCGHTESMWVELSTTDTKWVDAPQADPWGSWSYTGATDYDDIEDVMYYEQERFSSPCNRRETRWVTTRP